MARAKAQIVADIRAFQPAGRNWRRLDDLLGELWATGAASQHVPELLAVLERFPEDDGAGVLWSVVQGVESLPGYEPELVKSVQRQPSELGVAMVGRLLNAGVSQVGRVSLVRLLREVAESTAAPERVRTVAARWAAKHAEQIGEPELARLSVFQRRFLRLQYLVCQRNPCWSANPVTLVVRRIRKVLYAVT